MAQLITYDLMSPAPPDVRKPRDPYADDDDDDDEDVRYPRDPNVWVIQNRVTQTEISLHLGRFLLRSPLVDSNLVVTLAGYALTRSERRT